MAKILSQHVHCLLLANKRRHIHFMHFIIMGTLLVHFYR